MDMLDGFPVRCGFSGPDWELEDCVVAAKRSPKTFKVPDPEQALKVELGDLLRLHFLITDPVIAADPKNPRAERMWVEVCAKPNNDIFRGHLTNM